MQPDPIGYAAGLNLYTYCGNNPVNWIDPWGLWSNHNAFGRYGGGKFNYDKEDSGWTSPHNPFSTWRHFRNRENVEKDLARAAMKGDKDAFERHMHQGQDTFSHGEGLGGALNHIVGNLTGNSPDDPKRPERKKADEWTRKQELIWHYLRALEDLKLLEQLFDELGLECKKS